MCVRGWEINLAKVRGLSSSVKFQGSSGVGHIKISLLKWRISCGIWPLLQPKERHNTLSGLFGFWRQHIPHLGVLLWPIHQVTWKAANFERRQSKRRLCNRSSCCASCSAAGATQSSRSNGAWSGSGIQGSCLEPLGAPIGESLHRP